MKNLILIINIILASYSFSSNLLEEITEEKSISSIVQKNNLKSSFNNIPNEVFISISDNLFYSNPIDIINLSSTCKYLNIFLKTEYGVDSKKFKEKTFLLTIKQFLKFPVQELTSVQITNNIDNEFESFKLQLDKAKFLKKLNLKNVFKKRDLDEILYLFEFATQQLEFFDLSHNSLFLYDHNNFLRKKVIHESLIGEILQKNNTLKVLNLSNNQLDFFSCMRLFLNIGIVLPNPNLEIMNSLVFRSFPNLEFLDLSQNSLDKFKYESSKPLMVAYLMALFLKNNVCLSIDCHKNNIILPENFNIWSRTISFIDTNDFLQKRTYKDSSEVLYVIRLNIDAKRLTI